MNNPTLKEIFNKGRELAMYDGKLWDELSGFEKNNYYGLAEKSLLLQMEEEDES